VDYRISKFGIKIKNDKYKCRFKSNCEKGTASGQLFRYINYLKSFLTVEKTE